MKYIFLFVTALLFVSCSDVQKEQKNEQKLESLDKKSAREVTLSTVTRGDSVLHITKQHIWFNGEQIAEQADTIITPKKVSTWTVSDSTQTLNQIPIYVTVQ